MGFMFFLGFAIPFAVALDRNKEGPRDAMPSRGLCCLCKRVKDDTYVRGFADRICADDLTGVVHRSGARRIHAQPRSVGAWPPEKVADHPTQLEPLDPWWDRQFA